MKKFYHALAGKTVLLLFLVSLAGLGSATATTTYFVKTSGNDAAAGTTWGTSFRNISRALAAANTSTDTVVQIWIATGTYTPIDGISTLPSDHRDTSFTFYRGDGVGKALKVYGGFAGTESTIAARDTSHPTYLDGNIGGSNSYHVAVIAGLDIYSDSVVLDGLVFEGGAAGGNGTKNFDSAIAVNRWEGGGLAIVSCQNFLPIAIRGCKFIGNTAANMTGGTYYSQKGYGAGVALRSSNAVFNNCRFSSNSITGFGGVLGGAIYSYYSPLVIHKCTFADNYILSDSGTGAGSNAIAYGGAIAGEVTSLTMDSTDFTNNRCTSGIASMSSTSFSCGVSEGGAVYLNANSAAATTLIMTACNFSRNRAAGRIHTRSGITGGFSLGGAVYGITARAAITGCRFDHDTAKAGFNFNSDGRGGYVLGGALCLEYGDSLSTIVDCAFDSNVAIGGGGSTTLFQGGGACAIFNMQKMLRCDFNANRSINVENGNASGGGMIFASNRRAAIANCNFNDNKGISNGTRIGGGLYLLVGSSKFRLDSCSFSRNKARYGGGVACFQSANVAMTGNRFISDSAILGGGLYSNLTSGWMKLVSNTFYANTADSSGGAVHAQNSTSSYDTLFNTLFVLNKTLLNGSAGGAVGLVTSNHFVVNNTFYKDSAKLQGGGLSVSGTAGAYEIASNIFYGNGLASSNSDTALRAVSGYYAIYNNLYTSTNPLFADTTNLIGSDGVWGTTDDGLRLQSCSPAINTGNNSEVYPTGITTDIAGSVRIRNGVVDKGAYETEFTPAISGPDSVCIGSTITLTNAASGGTWVSAAPSIATVSSGGVVTGLAAGSVNIGYARSAGCITDTAYKTIKVQRRPAIITGTDTLCFGTTAVVTDSVAGGTWSSGSPSIASINAGGTISGIRAGTAVITYTLTNACGTSFQTIPIVVERRVSIILATDDSVCMGSTVTMSDSAAGGSWSTGSGAATISSSSGILTGIADGMASITYTLSNTCGTSSMVYNYITVVRPVSPIAGPRVMCVGGSAYMSDSALGGIWQSSDSAVVYPGASSTGYCLSAGTAILTYSVNNVCGFSSDTFLIRVDRPVSIITAPSTVICRGSSMTLIDSVAGGTWSVDNPLIATINSGGSLTGLDAGSVIVTYTLTNACGTTRATYNVDVDPPASAIAGVTKLCVPNYAFFLDTVLGGVWSSSNSVIASVSSGGTVYAVSPGTATISYTLVNGCGTTVATLAVWVPTSDSCTFGVPGITNRKDVLIFPNPATETIFIEYDSPFTAQLFDLAGRAVAILQKGNEIGISALSAGLYLLKITDEAGNPIKTFIVQKRTE